MNDEAPVILVVIADDQVRQAAGKALAARGFRVRLASDGEQALALIDRTWVSGVVLEAALMERGGALTRALDLRHPGIAVVVVQGASDCEAITRAMASGVREYLQAPFSPSALVCSVVRVIRDSVAIPQPISRCSPATQGPAPAAEQERQISGQSQQLAAAALESLVLAMEGKDPHLVGHSLRVADLAASIATKLGREDWEVEEVRLAGRLHDLGMIAIGDGILNKPGPLTPAEYAEVKRHPVLGGLILQAYPNMERVASYVRGHHERWDGAGYPDGLARQTIPWGARVLAAAEIFDALTSDRAYRSANSVVDALERMYALSADAIDPAVMRALQRVVSRRETLEFIREDVPTVEHGLLLTPAGHGLEEQWVA